ncbi:MAG: Stp1/IreP family PP2C-type Ser/Thr phosphatase [Erysipelotrichales bacterium]|nr:Stp1/IreP family PP2C-type Ser/Thr phosphatase [Erysipelotrichales bacterium]
MDIYGITDVGLVRESNQDRFLITYNNIQDTLSLVCDGIGGGKAGDVASEATIRYLEQEFKKTGKWVNVQELEGWIYTQLRSVNDEVFRMACTSEKYKGMGTTLVGALITKEHCRVMHVGDSRVYGLLNGEFKLLTSDHNYINELLRRGAISKEEAMAHPKRNYLTNAIGIFNQIRIDVIDVDRDFDALLLCSDGLHGIVASSKIEMILRQPWSAKEKCELLVKVAKQYGGVDNITIVIIQKEARA